MNNQHSNITTLRHRAPPVINWRDEGKEENKILFAHSRGVSLYLAIVIMSVILALALAISSISLSQIKMARNMGQSVIAFYAAETGVERTLFEISYNDAVQIGSHFGETLGNGSSYSADILGPGQPGSNCTALNYCLKSVGVFNQSRRAIFLAR